MSDRAAFLKQARERFQQAQDADAQQRLRELDDLRFYAGEQWEKTVLDARKGKVIGSGSTQQIVPARPSLTINKTREPIRQILNQERQSDMGIELVPADDWGEEAGPVDHTEIELREGIIRRIQRDSEAADARTWAFNRATIAGRGYWGVLTRYVPGKSWDQEVYTHRFYNQSSVTLDPAHEQPDGSDAEWGFVGTDMSWDRYKVEYPKGVTGRSNPVSTATDEEWRQLGDEAPGWFTTSGETRSVRVVDYWYTLREARTLALLPDGSVQWADELPDASVIVDKRTVVEKQIKWAKLDGSQVLEETDWPGHYIPIIKLLGEELQPYDGERRCEGVVRPMRDACIGNNYIVSKFVEQTGLTPIPPWMMAGGQDEGYEAEYDASTTRTLAALHYNQVDSFGKPAPPPFRTNVSTDVQGLAFGVQMFNEAIAATSVVPESALGHDQAGVKSGRLAKMLIEQANRGTSNFLDNLVRSMRHEARIINDLLYPIYGKRPGRLARLMNPEGEQESVLIGQPFLPAEGGRPQPLQQGQQHPQAKVYKLTENAEFNVAIKISKNYDTRREQEADTLGQIIAADPTQMGVIGDLFFKYQDGPGHEEMAERYKAVLVPPVQALLSGKPNVPPEVQQQMAQAQEQMTQMGQALQQMQMEKQAKVIESQLDLKKTEMELASKERIALAQNDVKLADIEAKINAGIAQAMIAWQAEHSVLEHQHSLQQDMAERSHQQALEQGEVGHQQELKQQMNQPQPEMGDA